MFLAPQWHGPTQTQSPRRPRKSAWHCDITNVILPHVLPTHYKQSYITRYRQSSRSPATRRVYTSMFRALEWHGATQTHFPPRPCKSAWHCDITNVISPRCVYVSRSAPRKHSTNKSARRCDITNVISPHVLPTHYKQSYITRYRQSSRSPATRRVYTSMFRTPQWHGPTQTHFPPRPRKYGPATSRT